MHRALIPADKFTPLKLATEYNLLAGTPTLEQQMLQWQNKALHGKYLSVIKSDTMNQLTSTAYLPS